MNASEGSGRAKTTCAHCRFGLIVTGEGEEQFLPQFFSSLMERAGCSFKVMRRIGPRGPVAEKEVRHLRISGAPGPRIPTRDEEEISLPTRSFLRNSECHFVLLVDDVEHDRRDVLPEVFERYRAAIDRMLRVDEQGRAAVHFLANMLEAYFFANSNAVNQALAATVLDSDFAADVETVRHPKGDLKTAARRAGTAYHEIRGGETIVGKLNVDHVLSNPATCGYLRSMFAWCVKQILAHCQFWDTKIAERYRIVDGVQAELTCRQ